MKIYADGKVFVSVWEGLHLCRQGLFALNLPFVFFGIPLFFLNGFSDFLLFWIFSDFFYFFLLFFRFFFRFSVRELSATNVEW